MRGLQIALAAILLTAGCGGDDGAAPGEDGGADAASAWFEEVAGASGVSFVHDPGPRRYWIPEIVAGGLGLFDFDADGDLDLYAVQGGDLAAAEPAADAPTNRLFENQGDGTFVDVTERAGVGDTGYGCGCAVGDVDGDGLLDLYVANVGPNVLYRNLGGGRFEDITEAAGAAGTEFGVAASFLDIDGDGDQDLFVVNYVEWAEDKERDCKNQRGQPAYCAPGAYKAESCDTLLLNRGDGTFEDVSEAKGLREGKGNGLGLVWGQLDGAPGLDVYVANDGNANRLWSWREDGPLSDRAMVMGCALSGNGQAEASMGVCLEDLDRDGSWDLMLSHIDGETNTFYMGGGRGYRDRTSRTGTTSASLARTGFGMGLADFDHDGWLDLYVSNGRVNFPSRPADPERPFAEIDQLFRGTAGARFEDLGPEAITGAPLVTVGRAAAFGDIDGDGDVDVCTLEFDGPLRILRNIATKAGGAAVLSVLERDGNAAVGAVVIYELAGKTVRRQIQRTYSYCAANGPDVHVGLGDQAGLDRVRVVWTDGVTREFGPVEAGERAVLRRD